MGFGVAASCSCAAGTAACIGMSTGAGGRAADALGTLLLCLHDIGHGHSHQGHDDCPNDEIDHRDTSFGKLLCCSSRLCGHFSICFMDQINQDTHHDQNRDQAGDKGSAQCTGGDKGADLID